MSMESFPKKSPEKLSQQLSNAENILGGKIEEDKRASLLGLNPEELKQLYPKMYEQYLSALRDEAQLLHFPGIDKDLSSEQPVITQLGANARGYGFKIEFSDESHVIKPFESEAEHAIAHKAAELGIGPKQFPSKEGFLHEEFIEGTPLLNLDPEQCTPAFMKSLGQKTMQALRTLHENAILVNDQILTDDFGKSHFILDKEGNVRFIDFGASINLEHFPNLSDDEVVSLMRTDMMYKMFRLQGFLQASPEEKSVEIQGYRENILSPITTKEHLIHIKDTQFLYEGMGFLEHRLPNVGSFREGVEE